MERSYWLSCLNVFYLDTHLERKLSYKICQRHIKRESSLSPQLAIEQPLEIVKNPLINEKHVRTRSIYTKSRVLMAYR